MDSDSFTTLDGIVVFVLMVAAGRGAFIGMVRESFSIAAVGTSCIALRFGNPSAATWLNEFTGGEIGTGAAPFITGAVILVGTVSLVGFIGRYVKRGVQAVGLGWADRLGGGALGIAEGALIATVIVLGATFLLGEEHNSVKGSHSVDAVQQLQEYVAAQYPEQFEALPNVAAPFKR